MGIILSRVRKKKSTIETLEKLDNDIKEIEENRSNAQRKYKKITKLLLMYSVGLYVLIGIIFYFQYNSTIQGKLLYFVPLAISPLLLYIVKKIISWYFVRLLNKNQIRLNEMKKEKKRLLDEVMDKETYKVAKQILEKFSSDVAPKSSSSMQLAPVNQPNEGVRRRITSSNLPKAQQPSNILRGLTGSQPIRPISSNRIPHRPLEAPGSPLMRLPAPILPLDRSYLDKVVEYLIGDGPNNRYALICSRCNAHNGMALKEEFEYIGFKCCYCFNFNPARKVKPEAPKLESLSFIKKDSDSDSDSKASDVISYDEQNLATDEKTADPSENSSEVINAVDSSTIEDTVSKQSDEAPAEDKISSISSDEPKEKEDVDQVVSNAEPLQQS